MAADTLTTIGTIATAVLGGGVITAITTYLRDRRKDKGDFTVSTFATLKEMNDRLGAQVVELQTLLDNERTQRRALEDLVDRERRERMRERGELALRIAVLEQHITDGEEDA